MMNGLWWGSGCFAGRKKPCAAVCGWYWKIPWKKIAASQRFRGLRNNISSVNPEGLSPPESTLLPSVCVDGVIPDWAEFSNYHKNHNCTGCLAQLNPKFASAWHLPTLLIFLRPDLHPLSFSCFNSEIFQRLLNYIWLWILVKGFNEYWDSWKSMFKL